MINSCICVKPTDSYGCLCKKSAKWVRHLLRSYLVVANYLLWQYATRQSAAKYNAKIFWYMQPNNRISRQCADDMTVESGKVKVFYNDGTLITKVSRKSVHRSIIVCKFTGQQIYLQILLASQSKQGVFFLSKKDPDTARYSATDQTFLPMPHYQSARIASSSLNNINSGTT